MRSFNIRCLIFDIHHLHGLSEIKNLFRSIKPRILRKVISSGRHIIVTVNISSFQYISDPVDMNL